MSRCTAVHELTGWRCNRRSPHDGKEHLALDPAAPPLLAAGCFMYRQGYRAEVTW